MTQLCLLPLLGMTQVLEVDYRNTTLTPKGHKYSHFDYQAPMPFNNEPFNLLIKTAIAGVSTDVNGILGVGSYANDTSADALWISNIEELQFRVNGFLSSEGLCFSSIKLLLAGRSESDRVEIVYYFRENLVKSTIQNLNPEFNLYKFDPKVPFTSFGIRAYTGDVQFMSQLSLNDKGQTNEKINSTFSLEKF